MERDFKGIWITKEVWLSKDLTLQEKVFYTEIDSLDNKEGCFASNGYFAEFFGLSKTRVSLVIKSLIDKGYVTSLILYKEGTQEILKRVLKVCYIPYITNVKEPTQGKLKDNNTINNTINNTVNKQQLLDKEETCCSFQNKDIYKFYEQCGFGLLNQTLIEIIDADIEVYTKEWLVDAMKEAVKQNKYKYSYVEGILRNWKTNGREVKRGKNSKCTEDPNREGIGFELKAD